LEVSIVRHAESLLNAGKVVSCPFSEVPLSDLGHLQARNLSADFLNNCFDFSDVSVIVSPYRRAIDTFSYSKNFFGLDYCVRDIQEFVLAPGSDAPLSIDKVKDYKSRYRDVGDPYFSFDGFGSESLYDCVYRGLKNLKRSFSESDNSLWVSHELFIKSILSYLFFYSPSYSDFNSDDYLDRFELSNEFFNFFWFIYNNVHGVSNCSFTRIYVIDDKFHIDLPEKK
jgi:broad specificity phosphatase PhoE